MASEAAAPLVLPSLQELDLPPVATAADVVETVVAELKDKRGAYAHVSASTIDWHLREKKRVPRNWATIVRMAAEKHYTVDGYKDELTLHPKVEPDAVPDTSLVLPVIPRLPKLSDADIINNVTRSITYAESAVEGAPLVWFYTDLNKRSRPSWDHVRALIARAAEPHWVCTFNDDEQSVSFMERDAGLYSQK
jgi:hypothetical protein